MSEKTYSYTLKKRFSGLEEVDTRFIVSHRHPSFPLVNFSMKKINGKTEDYVIFQGTEPIDTAYTLEGALEALKNSAIDYIKENSVVEFFKDYTQGPEGKLVSIF